MTEEVVIRAEGLGKKYLIGHEAQREPYVALRDVLARGVRDICRKTADMFRGRAIVSELAHDTAPAGEVNGEQCRDRPSHGSGAEPRELGRKTIGVDLKQPLGSRDVLQVMIAEVAQPDVQ